jgi:hypothetical protein
MRTLSTSKLQAFDAAQRALIAHVVETILPATDTPGAVDAGVASFVERVVCECYARGERNIFLAGMEDLEQECARRNGCAFAQCTAEQKRALLRQFESAAGRLTSTLLDPAEQVRLSFFSLLKELAVVGFFSSEIACTQVSKSVAERPLFHH